VNGALIDAVLLMAAWAVLLVPIALGVVRFFRTTRLRDLFPRIRRVPVRLEARHR